MKKILIAAGLLLGIGTAAHANSCTYINLTNCTYSLSTQGGFVTVPPGNTYYASPANISNPGAPPSGTFTGAKVDLFPATTVGMYVGTGGPLSASSATAKVLPACNNNQAFTVSWNVGGAPNFDIVMLFF